MYVPSGRGEIVADLAVKVTCSGAGPSLGKAVSVTLGDSTLMTVISIVSLLVVVPAVTVN